MKYSKIDAKDDAIRIVEDRWAERNRTAIEA